MALSAGTHVGPYEILGPLGAGGMGEVYRARDKRLGREVAIKVLPDIFANDPDRLARFHQEARLLAALNHPHIAAIYGLEESAGSRFLVLELVEGETLAERIARGPLPIEEALQVCRQIAEALEAAHERGIIHRDLKPANVKITPEGQVKVLDFGLGKAFGPLEISPGMTPTDPTQSPTLTGLATQSGVILGTAAYMSPEQARGKLLDKRTDIWSFGCVTYEALTGKRAFPGETVSDSISAILRGEPAWEELPEPTPARVRELLQRCLVKSPQDRLRDLGDGRLEIDKALAEREWTRAGIRVAEGATGMPLLGKRGVFALAIAFVFGVAAGIGLWRGFERTISGPVEGGTSPPAARLSIVTPPHRLIGSFQSSPDGSMLAYRGIDMMAEGRKRSSKIYTRALNAFEDKELPGTEDAVSMAFSPNGAWLAFVAPAAEGSPARKLYRIPINGSTPRVALADLPENSTGGILWLPKGGLVSMTFDPWKLQRFPTDGTPIPPPQPIVLEKELRGLALRSVLPDGRHLLGWGVKTAIQGEAPNVVLLDSATGDTRTLIEDGSYPVWSVTGHVLFSRRDVLLAVPFDPDRLEVTGPPVTILSGLRLFSADGDAWFELAPNGMLLYEPGGRGPADRRLVFLDRDGNLQPWSDERRAFNGTVAVSRDGKQVAVSITNVERRLNEIWTSNLNRPRLEPLVVRRELDCEFAIWSPAGDRLIYVCSGKNDEGGIYITRTDGGGREELLLKRESREIRLVPNSLSPDGSLLLLTRWTSGSPRLLLLPLTPDSAGSRSPKELLPERVRARAGYLSPDGRFVSYLASDTGREEGYLARFNPDGSVGRAVVVPGAGNEARTWSQGGRGKEQELYYRVRGQMMEVSVSADPEVALSAPRRLQDWLELSLIGGGALLPDGRWLAVQKGEGEDHYGPIEVVFGFHEEIRRRLGQSQ